MVLLVCTGSVLSALHLYEPLVDYAGAGASVPLIGFGHLLFQGGKEEMEQGTADNNFRFAGSRSGKYKHRTIFMFHCLLLFPVKLHSFPPYGNYSAAFVSL